LPPNASFAEISNRSTAMASYSLERELITKRYKHADLNTVTRLWTRLVGFATGMTLCLVGSAFVVFRLTDIESIISGSLGKSLSMSLTSTSPGIILSVLGTLIMLVSLTITLSSETRDFPTYFDANPSYGHGLGDQPLTTSDLIKVAPTLK